MKAIEVRAMSNYNINVFFDDGVSGIIDLNDLVQKGIFQELKDEHLFNKVYINEHAIAWSEELEIDADNLYAEILCLNPIQLSNKTFDHAAD